MLNSTQCIGRIHDATTVMDSAIQRVSEYWDDRVSAHIDGVYINEIVGRCSQALSRLDSLASHAQQTYLELHSLGR